MNTKNEMSVLNEDGDTTLQWDPTNEAEVLAMRSHFDALKAKGYLAFKEGRKEGESGEQIFKFDPKLGWITMVPRIVGG